MAFKKLDILCNYKNRKVNTWLTVHTYEKQHGMLQIELNARLNLVSNPAMPNYYYHDVFVMR